MKKTRNHPQMFVIAVVAGILFLPTITLASTTTTPNTSPAYIAQLEAELQLLEGELAALLATQSSVATTVTSTAVIPPVQVAVSNAQSSQSNGVGTYNFTFQVTNTASTTLYVPLTTNANSTGATGFIYNIQGANYSGEQSATTTCPTSIAVSTGWNTNNGLTSWAQTSFCVIPAGKTSEINVVVGLQPTIAGNYSVQFTSMNYTFNTQPSSSITYQNITLGNTANTNPMYIIANVVATSTVSSPVCDSGYTAGGKENTPYGIGQKCLPNNTNHNPDYPSGYVIGNYWICSSLTDFNDCAFGG